MPLPEVNDESVRNDLKKFYRKSGIESTEYDSGTLFTISSYPVRAENIGQVTAGLFFHKGRGEVLIDSETEGIEHYLTGEEKTWEAGGRKWIVVPEKFFWEFGRPAYWFVERNLTVFFGLENGFNRR